VIDLVGRGEKYASSFKKTVNLNEDRGDSFLVPGISKSEVSKYNMCLMAKGVSIFVGGLKGDNYSLKKCVQKLQIGVEHIICL